MGAVSFSLPGHYTLTAYQRSIKVSRLPSYKGNADSLQFTQYQSFAAELYNCIIFRILIHWQFCNCTVARICDKSSATLVLRRSCPFEALGWFRYYLWWGYGPQINLTVYPSQCRQVALHQLCDPIRIVLERAGFAFSSLRNLSDRAHSTGGRPDFQLSAAGGQVCRHWKRR